MARARSSGKLPSPRRWPQSCAPSQPASFLPLHCSNSGPGGHPRPAGSAVSAPPRPGRRTLLRAQHPGTHGCLGTAASGRALGPRGPAAPEGPDRSFSPFRLWVPVGRGGARVPRASLQLRPPGTMWSRSTLTKARPQAPGGVSCLCEPPPQQVSPHESDPVGTARGFGTHWCPGPWKLRLGF